jgi:predicted metal-dependent hydrolase
LSDSSRSGNLTAMPAPVADPARVADTVQLPHGPTPVVWRRSARARRVSLRIDPRASAVIVTLPARSARSAGLRLLRENAGWVSTKLAALPPALAFADGACVPIGGAPHRIRHVAGARGGAWLESGEILVAGDPVFLPRRVRDLLQAEARRQLGALVRDVAAATGLKPTRLAIRDTSSRWGSCTADGTVMFSWRLVLAPRAVQHYVVVHELAHLRHMNHGPQFWALVASLAPEMRSCMAWLKAHGAGLMRAGSPPGQPAADEASAALE